jgi:hypothetical protein
MQPIQFDLHFEQGKCPVCGTQGKRVDTATVKCMLSVSLAEVRDGTYFFCRDRDCPVVYFTRDSTHTFRQSDLRERVYQKEPDNDSTPVCYCFRFTVGDVRQEATGLQLKQIVDVINTGIQAGQCACDWRNPQGDCCLGNVKALIKASKQPDQSEP